MSTKESQTDRARRLHSSADLARFGQVSVRAVNKNPGLKPARVGSLYDLNHSAVQTWLAGRGFDVDDIEDVAVQAPRHADVVAAELKDGQANISLDEISGLRLSEIHERIGTPHETLVWVKVRKELAAAKRQEYLQARIRRLLVPVVAITWLVQHLNALTTRLIGSAVPSLVTRLMALGKSGGTAEQGRALATDVILSQVAIAKVALQRTIENIDTVGPLTENALPKAEDRETQGARKALQELEQLLRDEAAPSVVEYVTKRNALALPQPGTAAESVGTMLTAYIARVRRELNASPDADRKT